MIALSPKLHLNIENSSLLQGPISCIFCRHLDQYNQLVVIIIITRPWPAFGQPGLEWIIGWWPVRELYTSHASLRAFGAQLGRVHLSRVHFSRLASRLRRSARSNCARIGGNMKEFQHSNLPIFSRSVWKQEKWQKPLNLPTFSPSNLLSILPTFQPSRRN